MKTLHNIEVGTRFTGNINGGSYKVVCISGAIKAINQKSKNAIVLDELTGKKYRIGLEALKRYHITILN